MTVRGAKYPRKPDDFYATPPETTRALLDMIRFDKLVCDPASGNGAILKVLREYGYEARGRDLRRGYDFLIDPFPWPEHDIITNPPFGYGGRAGMQFVARALQLTAPWQGKVAMLLPVDFDSGKTRMPIFRDCAAFAMKIIFVNRIRWFDGQSGSTNHCWAIWDHKHSGPPILRYALQNYPEDVLG